MAINLPILSSLDTKGFDKAQREFKKLGTTGEKASFVMKRAAMPALGAITALAGGLTIAAKAAIEDEKSTKLLETQLRATLGPNQALADSVADFVDQTQLATGIADDKLRPALAGLVRYTGDASKAQDLLNLSINASIATSKDLSTVSTAIGKAYDGNFTALKKLGIPLDENIIKTKDFAAAQQALTNQFGGAAAANALTFSGRLAIMKIRYDELVESIGYKVLPVLDKALDYVEKLAKASDQGGLGGALNRLATDFRRVVDPAQLLIGVLTKNTDQADNAAGRYKQIGVNAANAGIWLANLATKIVGVNAEIPKLETGVDALNRKFAEAYTLTKAYSDIVVQLDADAKRAAYQKAVDLQAEKEAAAAIAKSTGASKAAEAQAKRTAAAKERQANATKALKDAVEAATNAIRDGFSPALMAANDKLTAATSTYNDFYNATADAVRGVFNIAGAWDTAANSEGAKNFFGVLDEQATKAKDLAVGIEKLIAAGLDDPNLLSQILAAGGDVGLDIINSILAGGKESIDRLVGLSNSVSEAAARIATITADKWFKSGVTQAQNIVDGINSVIANTEFQLKFVTTVEGAAAVGEQFTSNIGAVNQGLAPTLPFNPFGGVLGSINTSVNTSAVGGGAVTSQSININVNGGDPNSVVDALRRYMVTNGTVPIRVGG